MKTKLAIAVAAAVVLMGCDNKPTEEEIQAYLNSEAGNQARQQMAEDEKDLKATLAELQAKDPSVKDVYYGVDENGQKQLHIVREEAKSDKGLSDTVWPLVGGVATGLLLAQLMNSHGGMSNYSNQYPPSRSSYYNEDERRRARNTSMSSYNAATTNAARSRVYSNYRANPVTIPRSATSPSVSSRQSGVLSGAKASSPTSSARASSYSSGG